MREKEDRRLSEAIGKFFRQVKEDNDKPDDEDALFNPVGDKRVQILDDVVISDYIAVNTYLWN